MEPKALANLNGTLFTPIKNNTGPPREPQTVPSNHVNRRDSTVWEHSPTDRGDSNDVAMGGYDWDGEESMLTPVPKTPAPESIAQFAMSIGPETPAPATGKMDYGEAESPFDEDEDEDDSRNRLLMRTCPPKQTRYADLGQGLLRQEKDQNVLMRLMAARRKSLQFAPKIASPLSKAWN